jgi:predicted lysophospholipase L1 biosynthesis ABC-type transport system permease subunit
MKQKKGFDARRLRSRAPVQWRWRLAIVLATTLCCVALLLAMAGIASLIGPPASLAQLSHSHSLALLIIGLILLWLGILARRSCRARQHPRGLSLARHLRKKQS